MRKTIPVATDNKQFFEDIHQVFYVRSPDHLHPFASYLVGYPDRPDCLVSFRDEFSGVEQVDNPIDFANLIKESKWGIVDFDLETALHKTQDWGPLEFFTHKPNNYARQIFRLLSSSPRDRVFNIFSIVPPLYEGQERKYALPLARSLGAYLANQGYSWALENPACLVTELRYHQLHGFIAIGNLGGLLARLYAGSKHENNESF